MIYNQKKHESAKILESKTDPDADIYGALLGYYLGFWHGRMHPARKGAGA